MTIYKLVDEKLKQIQSSVYELTNNKYEKYDIISDLYDTRLKINKKSKKTNLINNVKNKIQQFFMSSNHINSIPKSIFLFIGHGWNTNLTFDISKFNNFHIVILEEQSCLQETIEAGIFNPFDIAYTTKNKPSDILYSFIEINKEAKLYGNNRYIHYDSENYSIVPDMVLSLHQKQNEPNFFIDIANNKTQLNRKTMLLSELVNAIGSDNDNNVILQIMTCRANITNFQLEFIPTYFPNKKDTRLKTSRFIRNNKKIIVNEDEERDGGDEIIQKILDTKIKNKDFKIVSDNSKIPDPPYELFYI
jgi:hypothetical protein